MTARQLRVVAIAAPLAYFFIVEGLSIFFLVPLMGHHSVARLLIIATILSVGTVPLLMWLFAKFERLVVMAREISERKRVEAEYRAIFDVTGEGLVIYTPAGVIVAANPAFCAMNGYTREELLGQNITMVIHPESRGLFQEFVQTIGNGGSHYARATNVRKDGTSFPVDVHGTLMVYDGALHILGVARDVTDMVRADEVRAARDRLQVWNAELEAKVAERTHDIERYSQELTRRVLQAQEAERKRIARELHDDTAQSLSSLLIGLDLVELRIPSLDPALQFEFNRVRDIAGRALDSIRGLAHGLRPTILDDFGLDAALEWIAVDHTRTFDVPVTVKAEEIPLERLGPDVELALFRIAQEALTNSGRHAEATSVHISLSSSPETVDLVVEDDGKGFDRVRTAGPSRGGGLGLHGIEERVQLIGAGLSVRSASGEGTQIAVSVPIEGREARLDRQRAATGTGDSSW